AGVDPDQEVGAPVVDEVPGVLHAHVDFQLLVAEVQLDGAAADSALGVDLLHGQGGALAHELAVASERAGEDALAADLDRLLQFQVRARGSERPWQREAGGGQRAGLEEAAACRSASRCHGETSDSEWSGMICPTGRECQRAAARPGVGDAWGPDLRLPRRAPS